MLLHPGSLCASGGAEASCPVKLSFSVGSHSKSRCTRFPDRKFLGKFMESPTKSSIALQAICYMRSSCSPESWHNFELVLKNLAKLCSASLFVEELQINQQCFACWFMPCWAPDPYIWAYLRPWRLFVCQINGNGSGDSDDLLGWGHSPNHFV